MQRYADAVSAIMVICAAIVNALSNSLVVVRQILIGG